MTTALRITALIGFLAILTFACGVNDNGEPMQSQELTSSAPTEINAPRKVHDIVDKIPLFGGCEDVDCSNQKLFAFIGDNMTYPAEAKEKALEGRVYVQFVVEADGYVSDIEVKKGIGGGTSEEAVSVVKSFNENGPAWSPGVLNGKEVAVRFTLPFSFKMES